MLNSITSNNISFKSLRFSLRKGNNPTNNDQYRSIIRGLELNPKITLINCREEVPAGYSNSYDIEGINSKMRKKTETAIEKEIRRDMPKGSFWLSQNTGPLENREGFAQEQRERYLDSLNIMQRKYATL